MSDRLTWEAPARPPEPKDPLWFDVALSLVLAALAAELGALAYHLARLKGLL